MQPILPIESLVVPVSAQSTQTVPGFPKPSAGFAIPTGIAWVSPQILAPDVRAIAESQVVVDACPTNIGVASYTQGQQAWFRRTGDANGLLCLDSSSVQYPSLGAKYLYFASKVKKHQVTKAFYNHKSYTVQRVLIHKQPLTTWRFNLFNPDVQTAWNASGGFYPTMDISAYNMMELTLNGAQEGPINEPQTLTWHPAFTQAPSVLGTQVLATLDPSPQKWLRMSHIENVVNGNVVDPSSRINALFSDEEQKARARQFALPKDWSTQKRDFDVSVLRQGQIPALNCVPLPSFEVNVSGSTFQGEYRKGFEAIGDFAMMAWRPVDEDDSSVWVLNRIRYPGPINVPKSEMATMGMSSWVQGDFLYETLSATAPIVAINPGKLVGMDCFVGLTSQQIFGWGGGDTGFGGARYTLRDNYINFTTERDQSLYSLGYYLTSGTQQAPALQSAVNAAIASNSILPIAPSLLGDFPCIGLTTEQAFANSPVCFYFQGGQIAKLMSDGENQVPTVGYFTFQTVRVAETGSFQTVFKSATGSYGLDQEILDELDKITDWANGFYCDPAKYIQVGTYEWKDSDGITIHSQPIYGHADLVDTFSVTVQFNAW